MLKTGYLLKQSKTLKLWETKWFVLQENSLSYYKHPNAAAVTESIVLDEDTVLSVSKEKKNVFTILRNSQKWVLRAEYNDEMPGWEKAINEIILPAKGVVTRSAATKEKLMRIKECFNWLLDKDAKIQEFWKVWFDHLPELDSHVNVRIATSTSMQKLAVRLTGPQAEVVQKIVDFFWFAGAPESEIDRLGDLGAFLDISTMGSFVEMSEKGGMDGGWFNASDGIPITKALEASEYGHPSRTILEWADKNRITNCFSIGRDMGGLPPWQTELQIALEGNYGTQMLTAIEFFPFFGFPGIPFPVKDIIEKAEPENTKEDPLRLSIIFNNLGFVQLGIHIPNPDPDTVSSLCDFAPGSNTDAQSQREKLQELVGIPVVAEVTYLAKGFGYDVYQEGFNVMLQYSVAKST